MNYESIILRTEERIATIILNRPRQLNAIDDSMAEDLKRAIDEIRENDGIRVLVLTGSGRAFCAGGDLQSHSSIRASSIGIRLRKVRDTVELCLKLRSLEKPVVASVNGLAFGAGCDLACACDMRIASQNATFAEAFVKVGLVPDMGGTYFLPRLVGVAKTCELIFTGDAIDAEEAERIGLVNKVVTCDQLESATKAIALKLAAAPIFAMAAAKRAIYRGLEISLATELENETVIMSLLHGTRDAQEGIRAFIEKRRPEFDKA